MLCGNVKVGRSTFIGANSVIRQGIVIGDNVIIGAGTVVVKDIPDNSTVIGNPARKLVRNQQAAWQQPSFVFPMDIV
ncbi:MAG: DapH/DapD/GlmU-related protein [Bacteroidota bacterium]